MAFVRLHRIGNHRTGASSGPRTRETRGMQYWFIPLALLAFLALAPVNATGLDTDDAEVRAFIDEVSERHQLDPEVISGLLAEARHQQDIIDAISRPAEAMPWRRYRPIFLGEDRIREGIDWWAEHETLIDRTAGEYGVDPAILVAIVGVETRYGVHRGNHRVLDALATLAFDYPPRADFFRSELEQFLLLVEEEAIDPLAVRGSYAGAMGIPQFISSSYRHYAVDGDGDGRRDLVGNVADAVASIGNYFSEHDWRQGEPVVFPARVDEPRRADSLANRGRQPYTTVGELREAGIHPGGEVDDAARATLMALEGEAGTEYWIGLHNFYVITRYNHSPLYALAVYQLAQAIREGRQ